MLAYYSGWNYLLELYFWLILGAILIISITIFFGRPKPTSKNEEKDMEILKGTAEDLQAKYPWYDHNIENEKDVDEKTDDEVEEEKTPEILIAEEKRKWALAFAVFGLVFVMSGGILLFISNSTFSDFLGSCMIYVGLLSLVKGISFQIPKDKYIINNSISLIVFFLNFFLLFHFLGVIGNVPMMERNTGGKFGNFLLVYILPYLLWRIVPSTNIEGFDDFNNEKREASLQRIFHPYEFLLANLKLTFFTFILFTSMSFYSIPILREYAKLGFNTGITLLIISSIYMFLYKLLKSTTRRGDK